VKTLAKHRDESRRGTHASAFNQLVDAGKHTREADCIGCHMPKRRTEDVVHVVATDHYIQRRKPAGDLLAEIAERRENYRGPVVLYYPETLPHTAENDLYLAIAQVNQKSNLKDGIAQLSAAIARYRPERAEYYFALAEAWRDDGQLAKALPLYREAVRRNPKFAIGLQKLGSALRRSGQPAEAVEFLKRPAAVAAKDPATWHELGLSYRAAGKMPEAVGSLQKAIDLDPDMPETHNNLGVIWLAGGEQARAEAAFREAIRIRPDYADAHGNLGSLLSGNFAEARYHFEISLRLRPWPGQPFRRSAEGIGGVLAHGPWTGRRSPAFGRPAHGQGTSAARRPALSGSSPHPAGIRPRPSGSRHGAGGGRRFDRGFPHLQKAAADADPGVRQEAAQALRQIGKER